MELDKDLASIQEARDLVKKAKAAAIIFFVFVMIAMPILIFQKQEAPALFCSAHLKSPLL